MSVKDAVLASIDEIIKIISGYMDKDMNNFQKKQLKNMEGYFSTFFFTYS